MFFIGLILIAISFYFINNLSQEAMNDSSDGVISISSTEVFDDKHKFKYLDGNDFVLDNLKKRFSLVYLEKFCSDDCKNILQKIDNIFGKIPNKLRDNMQFILFLSNDNYNSNITELNRYNFLQVIIAENEDLDSFKQRLIEATKEEGKNIGNSLYLINPKAKLVSIYTDYASIKNILSNIRIQFSEYAKSSYSGFLISKEFLFYTLIFCFGLIGLSAYALNKLGR